MTRRLRLSVKLSEEESALSIALRAARANHFGSVMKIEEVLGCSLKRLPWDAGAMSTLGDLVGVSRENGLAAIQQCEETGPPSNVLRHRVRYRGTEMSKLHLRQEGIAYCPTCLRENDEHRFIFQFTLCGICSKHGTPLYVKCPCGEPIDEKALFSRFCSCKTKRDLRRVETGVVHEGARDFWREVERRFLPERRAGEGTFPSIAHLRVDDLLTLFAMFLTKDLADVETRSLDVFLREVNSVDLKDLARCSDDAVARMLNWPDLLPAIVDEQRSLGGKMALLRTRSSKLGSLMIWRLPEGLRLYQEEVVDLVEKHRNLDRSRMPASGLTLETPKILAEHAAAFFGVKADKAFSLFRQPGEIVTGNRPRWLDAQDVDAFRKALRKNVFPSPLCDAVDFVTVWEARRATVLLKIDLRRFLWAVADGSIPAWFSWQGRPTLATTLLDRRGFAQWCRQNGKVGNDTVDLNAAEKISDFDEDLLQRLHDRELQLHRPRLIVADGEYVLHVLLDICARYARLTRAASILNISKFKTVERFKLKSQGAFALVGAEGELHLAEEQECRRVLYNSGPWI